MKSTAHLIASPQAFAQPASLLGRLAGVVAARFDRPATIEGDRVTSYGSLWARITSVGQSLQRLIEPGDRVAVIRDNSADYVVAVYATWYAGGVAVGLNTASKSADLLQAVRACGARVVLLGDKARSLLAPLASMDVLVLDAHAWQADGGTPSGRAPHQAQPSDAAALIFTSGTTGEPKGVLLSHGNLLANVTGVQQTLPMQPDDVTLCVLPFHYAFGNSVLHTHLTLGATLVLENSLMYPQRILQRMAERCVTAFYGVPSSYYLLMERGHLGSVDLGALRYCAQAGGPMDSSRIERFCDLLPHVGFWVMYGQTEACSRLTTLDAADRRRKAGSVGRPLPDVSIRISTADGRTLPAGQVGEVCAQGPNVMQGYWQSREDTAATLRSDWLRTGDLGYLDAEGYLYLTGRIREIIKVGAHRVAPQEIERVIQSVPGVIECAVVPREDVLLGEVARACVVSDTPDERLRQDILNACRERLALYKVPRYVDFVGSLPRTASGKVRKHLLHGTPSPAVA